jgi:hypothetical protein
MRIQIQGYPTAPQVEFLNNELRDAAFGESPP